DGGQGIPLSSVPTPDALGTHPQMIFRLGLITAVLAVVVVQVVQNSRLGWGLFSIRDDEDVAETLGVPTFRFKMIALGLTSFLAGLSGAVHALQVSYVTIEEVFNIRVPLMVILMSILGGTRHWMGPVLGALVVHTMSDRLNRAGLEAVSDIIVGALLILMIVAIKEGLYLRMRERPLVTAIGAAVGVAAGFVLGPLDSAVTHLAYTLWGAVLGAMVPRWRRPRAQSGAPAAQTVEEVVGARAPLRGPRQALRRRTRPGRCVGRRRRRRDPVAGRAQRVGQVDRDQRPQRPLRGGQRPRG